MHFILTILLCLQRKETSDVSEEFIVSYLYRDPEKIVRLRKREEIDIIYDLILYLYIDKMPCIDII